MRTSIASLLGLLYTASELGLALRKRAKKGESRAADRGSLGLLWAVIVLSLLIAFALPYDLPAANIDASWGLIPSGVILFAAGLAIRWYAIIHLGRFFTVNVAIAADHRLSDTGPYRFVRHPSYTGALMAFLGLAMCMGNWASILVTMVPVCAVFLRRMHIEEAALLETFKDQYRDYMNRTKRLIPAVY